MKSRCYQEVLLPKHPPNPRDDCCYWSFSMATTESLKHDLGCCFYFFGYLILRLMLACLVMPLFAAGMTIAATIMIFPTLYYFYTSFAASKNIGGFAKLVFFIFFPVVAFASPASVCIWPVETRSRLSNRESARGHWWIASPSSISDLSGRQPATF